MLRSERAIRAVGLSKRFGREPAVFDGLDLELAPGAVTGIVGGNGSGKSTLLRIVAGVGLPSSGRVLGRPREVAIVPERYVPPANLSAAAYLTHLGRMRGLRTADARATGLALLDRLALRPGPEAAMKLLSKGNSQKVGIAQAFLVPCGLVVLDEPRAGLDPMAEAVLDGLVAEARDRGAIVVVSGHDESLEADRLLGLAAGRLSDIVRDAAEPVERRMLVRLRSAAVDPRAFVVLAGARPVSAEGDRLLLSVEERRVDAVLRHALDSGWSVVEVTASDGGGS